MGHVCPKNFPKSFFAVSGFLMPRNTQKRNKMATTVQWASRLLARSSREGRRRWRVPHARRESPWGPAWTRGLGSTHNNGAVLASVWGMGRGRHLPAPSPALPTNYTNSTATAPPAEAKGPWQEASQQPQIAAVFRRAESVRPLEVKRRLLCSSFSFS